jgi:hypothetical protein
MYDSRMRHLPGTQSRGCIGDGDLLGRHPFPDHIGHIDLSPGTQSRPDLQQYV